MSSRVSIRVRHWWLMALIAVAAAAWAADTPPAATPQAGRSTDPLGRETPFGTVAGFIAAMNADNDQRAAGYLEGSQSDQRKKDTARLLKAVLDRGVTLRLDRLSRHPDGYLGDGLSADLEQVGSASLEEGEDLAVILRRVRPGGTAPIWLFSIETLSRVPEAAARLQPRLAERIWPQSIQRRQFLSLPLFIWFNTLLAIPLSLVLARALSRALEVGLSTAFQNRFGHSLKSLLTGLSGPIFLVIFSLIVAAVSPFGSSLATRTFWTSTGTVLAIVGVAWLLIRTTGIAVEFRIGHLRDTGQPGRIAVTELIRWILAFLWFVCALFLILRTLGFDASAAVAGLGVGGIAVAFAAQKTIADLFGTVTVIGDEAIRVGDACRIGKLEGRVESIGLRSTRIRSLDRTVVTIPNGQLATMNIENIERRDKFLCQHTIRLSRETTHDELLQVLERIRAMAREQPRVDPATARLRLIGFGESSLDIELHVHVRASGMSEFLEMQEDLLLRIMDIVEACGIRVAVPVKVT